MSSNKWWSAMLPLAAAAVVTLSAMLPLAAAAVVTLATACGFPRPADVPDPNADDGGPADCTGDQACSGATPFCLDGACVACKSSDSCPVAQPACDLTSHECRACIKDAECGSGACDIAAGTCVEQAKILYVAPGGTTIDPCTRTQPCSFPRAATLVDAARPYIVLGPGTYTETVSFFQKTATIIGNAAVQEADEANFDITTSTIWLRNFKTVRSPTPIRSFGTRILYMDADSGSHLTIDDSNIDLSLQIAIRTSAETTIRNTSISHGSVEARGPLNIDRSTFSAGTIVSGSDTTVMTVLNSIFLSTSGTNVLQIIGGGKFAHNTFSGGGILCEGSVLSQKTFESNIFYNIDPLAKRDQCFYHYNLISPLSTVTGSNNITGDPMFVDAEHNDFRLKPGSPAINASSPFPSQPNGHDHDGNPRPAGAAADLGAFESSP